MILTPHNWEERDLRVVSNTLAPERITCEEAVGLDSCSLYWRDLQRLNGKDGRVEFDVLKDKQ